MNERFLILFFSFLLAACGNGGEKKKTPAPKPPQYYYYPRANVYFDSANKEYVFLANDGITWQTAKQIPNVVQGLMDKSVLIPNPPQPVWKDNEQHKLIYSSVLYITPEDTTAKKAPPPPPIAKTTDTIAGKEKRERKGFRKFVDKIFSVFKKDKKKKDTVE
jgi:hypothetical protein